MDLLLEAFLDPIAEGVLGFFGGGFRSVGKDGWRESKCRVQALFGGVWWSADHPPTIGRKRSTLGYLLSLALTLSGLR